MANTSYFASTPQCKASTNAPNLVDRIKLVADSRCRLQVRGNVPHFDVQRTSGVCQTNAPNLVDVPIFRVAAGVRASTGVGARLYGRVAESNPVAVATNQYVGPSHRIVTPLTIPMVGVDTYIDYLSWSGMLGAGHVMEVIDGKGTTLARAVSSQPSDSEFTRISIGRVAKGGYLVPTLDSGVLLVETGKTPRNA
jgi:hypothetical protein